MLPVFRFQPVVAARVQVLEVPSEIEVTNSAVDTTPPELVELTLSPVAVDISGGSAAIDCTARFIDDLSGVLGAGVRLRHPSGTEFVICRAFDLISGDALDGVYEGTATIPQFSPSGTWPVEVVVEDAVGNKRTLGSVELGQLGFPSEIEVQVADIEVAPVVLEFGDLDVLTSATQLVTITNLGLADLTLTAIGFDGMAGGDFLIGGGPLLPATLLPNETIDVEIWFAPSVLGAASAILQVRSNDPDQGLVEVLLSGTGVTLDPSDALGTILVFFDASVIAGTLVGSGPGSSGPERLSALRNTLEAAGDLIDGGQIGKACNQLLDALLRTDGVFPPPDFVAGTAVPMLASQIQTLRASLGCDVTCGDVDRDGGIDIDDIDRARDYVVRVTPVPPFELTRCSVSGEERSCTVADIARLRREEDSLPVTLLNDCRTAILDPGTP
jgi:hypothetical protein